MTTNEQDQSNAEKIAEFLGGALCGETHNSTHKFGNHKEKVWDFDDSGGQCLESGLQGWLASNDGTVAMQLELLKDDIDSLIETALGVFEMDSVDMYTGTHTSKSLNQALQTAILEILKGKKWKFKDGKWVRLTG